MDRASCFDRKPGRQRRALARGARQQGAVAVTVALSLVVLVGFAGLVLDLGRIFINKSELQNAADACALAAANELVCDTSLTATCPTQYLSNAQNAGIFVAGRNKRDFQASSVVIAPADVRFSAVFAPNSGYLSNGSGADPRSKYAMCIARASGIVPWFMGVLGIGEQYVEAMAVATRRAGAAVCDAMPLGICSNGSAMSNPPYKLSVGQWLKSNFSGANDTLDGEFQWIDYQPTAGGTPDLEAILAGQIHYCDAKVGDNVVENGGKQGAKDAFNTRFGVYFGNKFDATTAPPDKTGYAYPTLHPPASFAIDYNSTSKGLPPGQQSAYPNYQAKQVTRTPFVVTDYPPPGLKGVNGTPGGYANGVRRRVVAAPIIKCTGKQNTIKALACVLMLNPMGSQGTGEKTIYLEYLGLATDVGSPCAPWGTPGGTGGTGPMVPTLVQ